MTGLPAAEQPRIYSTCTEWAVCALPESNINYRYFKLIVRRNAEGAWYVTDGFDRCLGADGEWDEGVKPYGRGDDWIAAHRFTFNEALDLAQAAAPGVVVNGHTVAEALAAAGEGGAQ